MMKRSQRLYTELFLLFILAFIGWGMASIRRFAFIDIDLEDCIDLLFSYFMATSGYFIYKWLIQKSLKRIPHPSFLQLVGIFLAGGILVVIWETLINLPYTHFYYRQPLLETSFLYIDLPLTVLLLVGLSILFFPNREEKTALFETEKEKGESEPIYPQQFFLSKGQHQVRILPDDIAGIMIDAQTVWLLRFDGTSFLTHSTMKEWEEKLDPQQFFRINRQFILAREAVQSYQALSNQKLAISTLPGLSIDKEVVVSKYSASAFKKWLAHSA